MTWRQVFITLWRSFATEGRVKRGDGWGCGDEGNFLVSEMKCLTEAHTAGLGQPGVAPRPWPPTQCPFTPTAAASFLWSLWGPWILASGWSPYSYGNSRTRALELEGPVLPLDLTDLSLTCLLLWHETSSRHVPGSSLWPRANHTHPCLPLEGLPALWTKASFAEFTVEAGSEIPPWRFPGSSGEPECSHEAISTEAVKESPKWPRSSSGSWALGPVSWSICALLWPQLSLAWWGKLSLAQSIHQERDGVPLCVLRFLLWKDELDGAISKSLPATRV